MKIPLIKAADSYQACVATSTEEDGRRKSLLNASGAVREAGRRLREAASANALHDLDEKHFSIPEIDTKDFYTWVYGNGMSTTAGRKIRGRLMAAPPNERCPMCRQGTVYQLDHFLPKTLFPALCVDPLNLVPMCERCNLIKGNRRPDQRENTLLHPYLDRMSHERWLDARTVHEDEAVRLEFFVTPPATWGAALTARVTHHFELFGLGHRYAVAANRVVGDVTFGVNLQRERGGAGAVRIYLQGEADTRFAGDTNSIEGVAYATLAADDDFCEGRPRPVPQ
ncbi:HNH endonuclease signature motif containing protein [[Kitasatospora] papulosa]|uniref:HNH endonuclease signature motif containing protein n=1 Tax=[Kitasatospora] papulosa TaxID=1464011 RepID=UPI003814E2A4